MKKCEDHYCGECFHFTEEDSEGYGYCLRDDMLSHCGDLCCVHFEESD